MDRYILENERIRMGYTQEEWAEKLGMSLSAYKRFITYESSKINADLPERFYELTGRLLYEDYTAGVAMKFKRLSKKQQKFIEDIIDFELNFDETGRYTETDEKWDSSILRLIHNLFNR